MKRPLVYPKNSDEDIKLQELIEFYNETLGFCPNSVKTMHIRPKIAYAFIEMNKAVMECEGRVTASFKRLIGFICSMAAGCQYCQAHTIRGADRYGAPEEQLENIWDYPTHPAFTDAERAALDFARAASTIPNSVDDPVAELLRKHWDDGEIVEILGVISLFGYLNRWNDSMGTMIENEAAETGEQFLKQKGWTTGKHHYQ